MLNVIKGILKYSPAKIIVGLSNFMLIPLLAKNLTPEEFGLYSLLFTIATLLIMLGSGWITQATLRYYYEYKEDRNKFLGTSVTLIILINISISLLILVVTFLMDFKWNSTITTIILFLMFINSRSLFNYLQTIIRNENKVLLYTIVDILLSLGTISLLYFLLINTKLKEISFFAASSVMLLILIIYLSKKFRIRFHFNKKMINKIAIYGIPLIFLSGLNWVMTMSDRIIISIFESPFDLGVYSANYSLIERVLLFITSMLTVATGPLIMKTWTEKGKDRTTILLKQITTIYLWLTVPIVFVAIVFGKEIIDLVLGNEYFGGAYLIAFISIGVFFQGVSLFSFQPLLLENKSKKYAQYTFYAALLNLSMNVILVSYIGIIGAGISTLITYMALFGFSLVSNLKSQIYKFPYISLLKTIIAAIFTVLFMKLLTLFFHYSDVYFLYIIIISIFFYLILLFLFKELKIFKN